MMMQQKEPTDLVIATGETHSVREFVELAFAHIGVTLRCPTSCSSISECSTLPIFAIWLCEGSCKQQLGQCTANNYETYQLTPQTQGM